MADVEFTVFSLLGFLLCILPAYFNWKTPYRPWATLILVGWIMLLNLLFFIDSLIWRNPDPSTWWDGKGYCDIVARLKDMFTIGISGAAVGICRFLADASNPDPSHKDLLHDRRKRNLIDVFLGIILPMIIDGLKFIVEYSRYHVAGVNGCTGTIDYSWPTLVLWYIWCPLLCLVSAGYACKCSSS